MTARSQGVIILSAFLAAFLFSAGFAFAQENLYLTFIGGDKEVSITMVPNEPRASETVRLSVDSGAIDLDRSVIVWYSNKKEFARGNGLKDATILAGPLGSDTVIEVVAESNEATGRATARIRPVEIHILWNSDSYVPPFFKGRALPGTSGTVSAYALVHFQTLGGTLIPEKDIIYSWYQNGARVAHLSGRGKSSATFQSPARFDADTIKMAAESLDARFSGSTTIVIPREDAKLVLYENHPLFGILFHRAIVGEVNTAERELKVSAFPYFVRAFSPREETLFYEWHVNDKIVIPDKSARNSISITTNNYTGPADIALSLSSDNDIFTRAEATWRILFGESFGVFFDTNVFGQ